MLLLLQAVEAKKVHLEPLTDFEFYSAISLIIVLVIVGGIVAGLTIGLMSLDNTNLTILKSSGTPKQKLYASRIEPIRKNGHLLLVTLLLVNTLVNETLPILFDYIHMTGINAVLCSVVLVLLFGEIIPQALCNRYGLEIGAFFAYPVRLLMFLMWMIAYPIATLLDYLLGHDHGMIYRHAELKELVALHGEDQAGPLSKDEVSVLKAVLDLREKTVANIMTNQQDVFSLPISTLLDRKTLHQILTAGHSRIPICADEDQTHYVGVVLVKQLILNDPDDKIPISSLRLRRLPRVHVDTALFEMLHIFETGGSHMAAVVEPVESSSDQFVSSSPLWTSENADNKLYKTVGIVTLEDVIEELLGEEIIDETDVYIDMSSKVKVTAAEHYRRLTLDSIHEEADEREPLLKRVQQSPHKITLPTSIFDKKEPPKKKLKTLVPAQILLRTPEPVFTSTNATPQVQPSDDTKITVDQPLPPLNLDD